MCRLISAPPTKNNFTHTATHPKAAYSQLHNADLFGSLHSGHKHHIQDADTCNKNRNRTDSHQEQRDRIEKLKSKIGEYYYEINFVVI